LPREAVIHNPLSATSSSKQESIDWDIDIPKRPESHVASQNGIVDGKREWIRRGVE
jgi:hypothetical protein